MADFSAAELEITELPERESMAIVGLSLTNALISALGLATVFIGGLSLNVL